MAGMTDQGFVPKTLAEIQQSLNASISEITDDTGQQPFLNVEDDSVLQQIIGIISNELAVCWNAAKSAYDQFDPQKNVGAGQSGTVQLNGIVRHPGTPAQLQIKVVGRPNTTVPQGTLYGTPDGSLSFAQKQTVQLAQASTPTVEGLVEAVCTTNGRLNLEPGEVSVIQTNVTNLFSASNTETLVEGTDEESDAQLRVRQQRSTATTSYRQIDAIYAAVSNVDGVTYCRAYQNTDTQPEDDRGIPYKEVAVVVEGGDPLEIAKELFLRFPVGVLGYGTSHYTLYDNQGISYAIQYSRPETIPITVDIQLRAVVPSLIPEDYPALMRAAIIDYARYGFQEATGFPPGEDIIRTQLYTPINSIPGFEIVSVKLKGGPVTELAEVNVPIAWNEVGTFDEKDIFIDEVA